MAEELKLSEKIELSEEDRLPEPATGCKATIEGLYESKYQCDETDDCPNCMKLKILCFVSNHHRRETFTSVFTSKATPPIATTTKLQEEMKLSEKDRKPEPATGCKATIEGLYESKYQCDETDDCPNCMRLKVLCFVSNHHRRKTELAFKATPPTATTTKLQEKMKLSEKDRKPEPATGCLSTIEGLYESKYHCDETDDCPNCMKLKVLCFVSNHRRRETGKYVLKLFSFYVFMC